MSLLLLFTVGLMGQNFGLGLCAEDQKLSTSPDRSYFSQIWDRTPITDFFIRPWSDLVRPDESCAPSITIANKIFKVTLDMQQFKPEEISLKILNKFFIVEAKHEDKKDKHDPISGYFFRKYFVPERVDIEQLKASLSSDGVLIITAPIKKHGKSAKKEKVIPIEQTGKPAIQESTKKLEEILTDETDKKKTEKEVKTEEGEKQDTKPKQ